MLVTVDTGATKTLVAEFGKDGKIGEVIKFPTPVSQEEYVTVLRTTLQKKYADTPVEAVVIALPGIIKDGVALWCNNLGWTNFDAGSAFKDVLGKTPVLIENDANLGGLGEARSLDPTPVSALYVTISTGIGTGVITNGRIDPGLRYSEGGRSLVEFEGEVREWESFASGKSIHKAYNQFGRDITSEKIWNQIADRISRGFLAIIPFIQPDVIILGGSMGTHFKKYHARLEEILKIHLPPHIPCPRIVEAKHPEEAVIYGCYYYALDYLSDK
jgi:predicted NBD/HSP70 family sugar kinase